MRFALQILGLQKTGTDINGKSEYLLLQRLLESSNELAVHGGTDLVLELNNSDLRAKSGPNGAKLKSDDTATDNCHGFGNLREGKFDIELCHEINREVGCGNGLLGVAAQAERLRYLLKQEGASGGNAGLGTEVIELHERKLDGLRSSCRKSFANTIFVNIASRLQPAPQDCNDSMVTLSFAQALEKKTHSQ